MSHIHLLLSLTDTLAGWQGLSEDTVPDWVVLSCDPVSDWPVSCEDNVINWLVLGSDTSKWLVIISDTVPDWLLPSAESLPPMNSTIGLKQLSFLVPLPSSNLCLKPLTPLSWSFSFPFSSSQIICLLCSLQLDSFASFAVSTSLKMARTLSLDRSGRAASYSFKVVGSRDTGWKMKIINNRINILLVVNYYVWNVS